jgi:hypothetical protein
LGEVDGGTRRVNYIASGLGRGSFVDAFGWTLRDGPLRALASDWALASGCAHVGVARGIARGFRRFA